MSEAATIADVLTELRAIREALSGAPAERCNAVFDRDGAAAYCGFKSPTAFNDWVKKLKRKPPLHGRYPQPLLDEWLAQECRLRPKK